jgi:GST-like protein
MIDFYYNTAPNPRKVALFLEEAGVAYRAIPIDTRKGEQHAAAFLKMNPNGKVPAIVDDGVAVFDSNAILIYLADKHAAFLPSDPGMRGPLLSWLMFVASGVGPYSGQAVHFGHFAPEKIPFAINRYRNEVVRHWRVLDEKLGQGPWILGDDYTIADMAAWGWSNPLPFALGDDAAFDRFPNVKRWREAINARPAAQRAMKLGADVAWKTETDEAASRALFPSNY